MQDKYTELNAERTRRRRELLNAAARRLGYGSWVKFEGAFRNAMDCGGTDAEIYRQLKALLAQTAANVPAGSETPPEDVLQVYTQTPRRIPRWK